MAVNPSTSDDGDDDLLDTDLNEDIAAELEDFVLCARLGLEHEARQAIHHILIHHINIFAVFAEIGSFFLEQEDYHALESLFRSLIEREIEFDGRSEKLFREKLHQILSDFHSPMPLGAYGKEHNLISSEVEYADPAFLHTVEIECLFLAAKPDWEYMDMTYRCHKHFCLLLKRTLSWEATRIMTAMGNCLVMRGAGEPETVQIPTGLLQGYDQLLELTLMCYDQLMIYTDASNLLQAITRGTTTSEDEQGKLLCMLSAKATMLAISTIASFPTVYTTWLRQEFEQTLALLFRGRDGEKRRSMYYQLLETPAASRKLIAKKQKTDQPPIRPSEYRETPEVVQKGEDAQNWSEYSIQHIRTSLAHPTTTQVVEDEPSSAGESKGQPSTEPFHIVEFESFRFDVFRVPSNPTFSIAVDDFVIVSTDRGVDIGTVQRCQLSPEGANEHIAACAKIRLGQLEKMVGDLPDSSYRLDTRRLTSQYESLIPKRIIRPANPEEISTLEEQRFDEARAKYMCETLVEWCGLNLYVLYAEYQMDRKKLTFYYVSDQYIDISILVTSLALVFGSLVEMNAIPLQQYQSDVPISMSANPPFANTFVEKDQHLDPTSAEDPVINLDSLKLGAEDLMSQARSSDLPTKPPPSPSDAIRMRFENVLLHSAPKSPNYLSSTRSKIGHDSWLD